MDIATKYDPAKSEDKWYKYWMEQDFFRQRLISNGIDVNVAAQGFGRNAVGVEPFFFGPRVFVESESGGA